MTTQKSLDVQMWNAIKGIHSETFGEENLKALTVALNMGANPNAVLIDGDEKYTPLLYVTEHMSYKSANFKYQERVAALLIDRGADVNARDESGFTPLMAASDADSFDTVKLLVDKGADINAIWGYDSDNRTALGFAYRPEIMQFLLEHGANPNKGGDISGDYPLHRVCLDIHLAAKHGTDIYNNHLKRIAMLLDYGANPNAYNLRLLTPMMLICVAGQSEEYRRALSSDGKIAIIKMMFEHGANLDQDSYRRTALGFAAESEDWPVVEALAFNGADINRDVVPSMPKEKSERVWAKLRQIIKDVLEWERKEEERRKQEALKERMTWHNTTNQKIVILQQGQKTVGALDETKQIRKPKSDEYSM